MAVMIDLTGLGTFMPIFAFLLVFTLTYALLAKTKLLGEQKFVHIFVSFLVSIVFIISANAIEYVKVITPFFAAFIVSLLFILLVIGLIKGDIGKFFEKKGFTWFVVIILIIIFVFAALFIFAPVINQYMSGPKRFLLQPQILGVLILIGLTAFTAWLLTKK